MGLGMDNKGDPINFPHVRTVTLDGLEKRLNNIMEPHPVSSGLNPNQHNRGKGMRRAKAGQQ